MSSDARSQLRKIIPSLVVVVVYLFCNTALRRAVGKAESKAAFDPDRLARPIQGEKSINVWP